MLTLTEISQRAAEILVLAFTWTPGDAGQSIERVYHSLEACRTWAELAIAARPLGAEILCLPVVGAAAGI